MVCTAGGAGSGDPGPLRAWRASDGTLLWSAGPAFSAGPVVGGGSVYVSDGVAVWALAA